MQLSDAIWLAVAAGVGIMLGIIRVVKSKRDAHRLDAGSVSHRWVTEHRVGSGNDTTR